jgi:cysteine desulfuration protein SufE
MDIDDIYADFELLDDWEDRYRYVIELGRNLEPLPDEARTPSNKVQGCVSQVWLSTSLVKNETGNGPELRFIGDSDAHIVRGLVAILFVMYSGQPAQKILGMEAEAVFDRLGLRDHLTPQRSNGLMSMVKRIRADAQASLEQAPISQ